MKPLKMTAMCALLGALFALGGCAADVGPSEPTTSGTTGGENTGTASGSGEVGGAGGGTNSENTPVETRPVGQPNGNQAVGTQGEEPVPNPWTGGNVAGGGSQAPTNHHHGATAKSDIIPTHN
jgi:hypothetical protein